MASTTMKGWQYTTLSSHKKLEENITLSTTIPAPTASSLTKNQLLISVTSAAINPADYKLYEAGGLISKMAIHLPGSPGLDYCGKIVALHPSNTTHKIGDTVFGCLLSPARYGSLAEKMVISSRECALLPEGVSPDDAAAAGTSGITAYLSYPSSIVKPGSKVFINGGSGGTGTFGIQIAKVMGAHVTTSCSTANVKLCESLGADEVIDYKKQNVLQVLKSKGPIFDLVVDNAGSPSNLYEHAGEFLKPNGVYNQVALQVGWPGFGSVLSRSLKPRILGGGERKFHFVTVKPTVEGFGKIGEWMRDGKVKAVVQRTWELEEVRDAFAELRLGRTKGKFVVHVGA